MKSIISGVAKKVGISLVRTSTLSTLRRESWLLREQAGKLASMSRELEFSRAGQSGLATSIVESDDNGPVQGKYYTPIYDYAGLRTAPNVIHNHNFMMDPKFVSAYRRGMISADGFDQKNYWRIHVALWCASVAEKLPGDFVEAGVWRGIMSSAIMDYLNWNTLNKHFYLFDTFRGIDEEQLSDEEILKGNIPHFRNEHGTDVYADVVKNFSEYKNVTVVRGSVPSTLETVKIDKVCYLSIDMNNAVPEIATANYYWDKLSPGAPILLDDYGFVTYEVQKREFDKWAAERGVSILHLPTGQGLILKP